MALSLQLLGITLCEWEHSGHMEHDLLAQVLCEHAVLACLAKLSVQATSVPSMCGQCHSVANHVEKLIHGRAVAPVAEHGLLGDLSSLLVDHAKLEVIHKIMPENIKR